MEQWMWWKDFGYLKMGRNWQENMHCFEEWVCVLFLCFVVMALNLVRGRENICACNKAVEYKLVGYSTPNQWSPQADPLRFPWNLLSS
jgi:hypothetical protein